MPFDATGFIQCKNRYRNQTQLLDVAHGYVDRNLPISIIVIDWSAWGAGGRGRRLMSPGSTLPLLFCTLLLHQCTMLLKVGIRAAGAEIKNFKSSHRRLGL
jgi:hypothetical protein